MGLVLLMTISVIVYVLGLACAIDLAITYFKKGRYFIAGLWVVDIIMILFNFIKLYFAL